MPLHITKIAYGSESIESLAAWLERGARENGGPGHALMTTRYLPKRVNEMAGGSLYWIHSHIIVGRSPIIGFEENGSGRYSLLLEPRLIRVRHRAKRAHQGWRYLEAENAPADLMSGTGDGREEMPQQMLGELSRMGLV